jgi:hypothetical protein
MAGESTLIATTRTGVRPLGVRGEPLHNWAAQLRGAIRRRLGDGAADLLADPQLHEDGKAIDWYAGWAGEVHKVADLEPVRRSEIVAQVDAALGDIARFGATLAAAGQGEDSGLIGRSLQLAAKRPAESFVFLVGDRPVVVCWGYEKEAAASLMGPALPRVPQRRSVLDAPAPPPVRPMAVQAVPVRTVPRTIPWFRSLLLALPLLLLLLGGAWLLRELLPADPETAMATREGPDVPAPAAAPADPLRAIKASLSTEQARQKALRIELAAIEGELKKRVSGCKPPEPPKPPQTAMAAPPPAAKPSPPPSPSPPQSQPQRPSDGRMRLPTTPTRDFSFMAGCWRTDPFKHEPMQMQMGVSSYCFDANGYGSLEWRRGRTACRTSARAVFNGPNLALRDQDTTCNDGSHWYADQLVCRRGADNVADCEGYSRGAFGPTSWLVNLHRIR